MPIELTCPNGHTLTAKDANAGKTGKCPVCQAPVLVPMPKKQETVGSSIVASLLGELNAQAAAQMGKTVMTPAAVRAVEQSAVRQAGQHAAQHAALKTCPNCDRDIEPGYQVCPYCRAYLSGLNEF